MIHAYPEIYVNKAQSLLGEAFDYAVNVCGYAGETFTKMFCVSNVSRYIEKGEHKYVLGKSGIEIAREVVFETTSKEISIEPKINYSRSREYWIGWAIAYYQWHSGRRFAEIFSALKYEETENLYYTLHEADISKFCDIADKRVREVFSETTLKRMRKNYGCSQAELSALSGVSLRSIQMYEQRNKDINKASVETVFRLAKALGCDVETLIEK